MRTTFTTIALALLATVLLAAPVAASTPVAESPPIPNWDGTDAHVRMEPPTGDQWFGGYGSNRNLPPILDFDTTMGVREQQIADEMLAHINNERTARGLDAVTMNNAGVDYSVALAHRNSAIDATFHSDETGPETLEFYFPNWIQDGQNVGGYPRTAGENVGGQDGVAGTSADQVLAYMNSSAHRTSLLGDNYDAIGIGVACQVIANNDGTFSGVMRTVITPIRTQATNGSPTPFGNPAPAGTVTVPDTGTACFDSVNLNTGEVGANNGGTTTPTPPTGDLTAFEQFAADPNLTGAHADILRLYWAAFDREPDVGGAAWWVNAYNTGAWPSLVGIAEHFAVSEEFITTYGQLTNTEFVDAIYLNVLDRPGEAAGRAFWINELNTGNRTRGEILADFSYSDEFRANQPLPSDGK